MKALSALGQKRTFAVHKQSQALNAIGQHGALDSAGHISTNTMSYPDYVRISPRTFARMTDGGALFVQPQKRPVPKEGC